MKTDSNGKLAMSTSEEIAWPQKGKRLFLEGGDYHEFSHFGWGGVGGQLVGYMDGYKAAADALVDRAIESRDISILDTFVFPIFFLYRQYLELVMKYAYLSYSGETKEVKTQTLRNVNHDLVRIWTEIKPMLLRAASEAEAEDVEIVEDYIKQFHAADQSSFTFRYPITKELNPVLTKETRISLPNLKERMEELANFFDGATAQLDAISEIEAEMFTDYFPLIA